MSKTVRASNCHQVRNMNALLKCFFENFENMERNSLHARYKRRAMVEYFNILIEGCRLGEQCDPQKTVREAIICILRYHEESKKNNGSVCMMGKYHNVLYIGLKICYDWQLRDTATVAALLDEIYLCEKTFERLIIGALFGTTAPHFIAGWKSDFENQEENLRALVFFLDHATNAGLEYSYGLEDKMLRFIDVPVESCGRASCLKIILQLGLPDKLIIFLRYGAQMGEDERHESIFEIVLTRLADFKGAYPYNYVSCLQILLRAVDCVNIKPDFVETGANVQRDFILKKFPFLITDCILPMSRCGFRPPELKHLCRCSIRRQLWLNYQLPGGIKALPIPVSLQRYIDIMED